MRKIICLVIAVIFTIAVGPALSSDVFFVSDDNAFAPFISADSKNKPVGIFYDIVTRVFELMGEELKYEVYPWKRAQHLVKEGKADALITIPTEARLKFLMRSEVPIFAMNYKIFTQKDNPNIEKIKSIKNLDELDGLKIIDYLGDGWAEENLGKYGIEYSSDIISVCKKLAQKRGDVFVQDELTTLHTIKKIRESDKSMHQQLDNIVFFDLPVEQIKFYLLVHKDSKFLHLMDKINRTMKEMEKSGELAKIKAKWVK